jgi:hypothetical protein
MSLEPGQNLSHYRIVQKIGESGMGRAYLAEDGSSLRQLTDLPSIDPYWPAFSPDGKYMSTYGPSGSLIFEMNKESLAQGDAIIPTAPDDRTMLLASETP